ncbi:MAG TPA: hypothetical protein VF131_27590 [Blastocatellia bacterium]|nr:hypothetical protein [Blastocatellia bacterium]
MRKHLGRLSSLFVSLALLAVVFQAHASDDLKLNGSASSATQTKELKLPVSESAKKGRLQVRANVKSGTIRWTLRDPEGIERLTVNGSGGRVSGDTGEMTTTRGTWKLVMELKDATLDYEIDWVAR